jgi:hypothetical protein
MASDGFGGLVGCIWQSCHMVKPLRATHEGCRGKMQADYVRAGGRAVVDIVAFIASIQWSGSP